MEDKKENTELVPMSSFRAAFSKLKKCKPAEFELAMVDHLSASVTYKGESYQIRTYESLLEETKQRLTDKDQAHHLNLWMLIEVFEYVKFTEEFYLNLIELLNTQEDYNTLKNAIIFHGKTSGSNEAFWHILQSIDRVGDVYGNSIVAVSQIVDLDMKADELLDTQICDGLNFYTREGDVFEIVDLETKGMDEQTFYIYTSDF